MTVSFEASAPGVGASASAGERAGRVPDFFIVGHPKCGNTWFSAAYGANGVYYTVVPTP